MNQNITSQSDEEILSLWHWNRWEFGKWERAFTGTREERIAWYNTHHGKYILSKEMPTEREEVGRGW